MRSRMHKIAVGFVAVLAITACGQNDQGTESHGTTAGAPVITTPGQQDEGAIIDVNAKLLSQGFKQIDINAAEKNAAYWLMPFQSPLKSGQKPTPGSVTCTFFMVHRDYKKGDAYADHRIKENSVVRLTAYVVGSDGQAGASLPKSPEIEFSKLTPAWLASADKAFGGLKVCGTLTVG
jgi:hypothetical protein